MKLKYHLAAFLLLAIICIGALAVNVFNAMGSAPDLERLNAYPASSHLRQDKFANPEPITQMLRRGALATAWDFFLGTGRKPGGPLPARRPQASDFPASPRDLQVVWLGHSSLILDLDGVRLLIDPVFENAAPVPLMVRRFQPLPLGREELPRVDAVIISHDHYDHLEMKTVKHLAARATRFIVPLGVGSHLEHWGCDKSLITELDWDQTFQVGPVMITAAPSRHFSGRGLDDRNKTLWASWVLQGPSHKVYYSGDGGYDGRFKHIGQTHGPFDLTLMECGAYSDDWPQVHMFPEQAVKAHTELRGEWMLPVHWAAYNLALHRWDDPIRRATRAAQEHGVKLATPMMGQPYIPGNTTTTAWWQQSRD